MKMEGDNELEGRVPDEWLVDNVEAELTEK